MVDSNDTWVVCPFDSTLFFIVYSMFDIYIYIYILVEILGIVLYSIVQLPIMRQRTVLFISASY